MEIVDQLPVIQAPTSANIDVTIKDVKATDQKEAQPEKTTQKDASENVAKTETQIDDDEVQIRNTIEYLGG